MARSSATPNSSSLSERPRVKVRVPLGWFWPLFWSGLMVGSGVMGIWAMTWLTRIPPLPDCEDVTVSSSDSNRLICAQTAMQTGSAKKLIHAIQLTTRFAESHPLHVETYPVLVESSERLLKKATEKMHEGDLATAVGWAGQIPLDTPLRQQAQAAIWNWQQEWKQGQAIENSVEQAIAARDWGVAEEGLQQLKLLSSDYWLSDRHNALKQAKQRESTAWAQIEQARGLANTGDPDNIGQALVIAQRVNLTSRAWNDAQDDIDRWSQNLLLYSFQRWELGDVEGAIAAVQKVPPDPNLAPEAQDLIKFSHANRLATEAQQDQPSYLQLFKLMEAIRAAEKIPVESTFYGAAQQSMQGWKADLEDLRTLQFASGVASLRQGWAYDYATQLAWSVDLERPRRLQAQTLIAHWENEVERIEDRPFLARANALARKSTIPALQAAIAEARNVALGRALRIEAQTAIADWLNQIEVIQDQPILNEANQLAADDKLREAVTVAQQIQDDRALYEQAQAMIQDWTHTIQVEEDSPILEEAKSLAYEGSLTAAINVAAQIAPGRALYNEARNAIGLWEAERAYIWAQEAEAARQQEAVRQPETDSPPPDDTAPPSSEPINQPPPPTSDNFPSE
ncbi:hypothetical protein PN498_27865 [Oscillatoria sp. CS-180]|uniref:hypothetical protein n=1 Tax=Oscillatoria sp. CS-180 TaxID=3021720 RepID=UPI00233109AF|nr:hypothetical protein [Oscillatoria sp. CS-180]MDB9529836.1 hypothetical protein [Oscillatoria sp. CS-180]